MQVPLNTHAAPHSSCPAGQLNASHLPALQLWPIAHGESHWPQCRPLVAVSTHELPHSVSPAEHDSCLHVPSSHVCPAAHNVPHAPQFASSNFTSVQAGDLSNMDMHLVADA